MAQVETGVKLWILKTSRKITIKTSVVDGINYTPDILIKNSFFVVIGGGIRAGIPLLPAPHMPLLGNAEGCVTNVPSIAAHNMLGDPCLHVLHAQHAQDLPPKGRKPEIGSGGISKNHNFYAGKEKENQKTWRKRTMASDIKLKVLKNNDMQDIFSARMMEMTSIGFF
ncbi:hypothetical protein ACFE04_011127 [Oxalis oulophora]